jgi:predicted dinucleotide-binding enzyme
MVGAFHTIAGAALQDLEHPLESDVFVCGSDREAKVTVGELIDRIPNLRWVDAGDLSMARIVETLTAVLVSVNRTYKVHDSGFRLTGRDAWGAPPERSSG